MAKKARSWTVVEAKSRFSDVIDHALTDGPQMITRNGRKTLVIISAQRWERRKKRRGSLAQFFASSPLRGSGIKIERLKDRPRKFDL